ncbi:hypothetical protein E1J38_008240 [Seonamhaeicola sediminis]|uniref:T9SS C-terminal target domain-containing protein n=1 Tax=Seonamhaeicola sediminis TaxID=2528206 RepID=A0A562YE06_9FLAO|nr:hypothetical protein [Seonamhaeicola sediminis]TWO32845.1 hypothetical protein E1J38_008240 [Seonamhaeicola sediminis]
MKKLNVLIWVLLFGTLNLFAQQEKGIIGATNWLNNWTDFQFDKQYYREPTQIITGNITKDTKLFKRDAYLLVGSVFVTNGATLYIEPGTVILGDYDSKASLTISKGSKIMAEGTETDPIIFSSNKSVKKAGDWGGLILLGDAPLNRFGNGSVANFHNNLQPENYVNTNYGGNNSEGSSGILKYVRIEYTGKRIKGAGYFNGLLLAGVGSKTVLENIMVTYSAGDAFEIWGGNITLSQAVSYRTSSNDFNFNYGTQCKLNNSLAIRSPYISSSEGSRCLKVLSYDKREDVDFSKNSTLVIANNITILNDTENLKEDIEKGLVKEGVFVGQNASLEMSKSVISGFNPAVILDDRISINQTNLEKIKFTDMYFNNCNGNIFTAYNSNNDDLENWYGNAAFFNVYSKSSNKETFIDIENQRRPDYRLRINKIIAINKPDVDED